jgi:hypothetical protein
VWATGRTLCISAQFRISLSEAIQWVAQQGTGGQSLHDLHATRPDEFAEAMPHESWNMLSHHGNSEAILIGVAELGLQRANHETDAS